MLISWLRSLGSRLKGTARPPGHSSPYRHRAILQVEALEDRTVPMAVPVINLNAGVAGSLAAAVALVDASTDASNSIGFMPGLTGQISITGQLSLQDTSGKVPNKEIDIIGPGSTVLGVQALVSEQVQRLLGRRRNQRDHLWPANNEWVHRCPRPPAGRSRCWNPERRQSGTHRHPAQE